MSCLVSFLLSNQSKRFGVGLEVVMVADMVMVVDMVIIRRENGKIV